MDFGQYQKSLELPALCEQITVRDLRDNLIVRTNGSFVAGYRVSGIHSYYASDDDRNRTKSALETLVRSLPEQSMRLQIRFEISQGTGNVLERYRQEQRNPSPVLQTLDQENLGNWVKRDAEGYYLRHFLNFYFIWDPRIHHAAQQEDGDLKKKLFGGGMGSVSVKKCIERSRREHEDLVAEFMSLMSGISSTMHATGMTVERMSHDELFMEIRRALSPIAEDEIRRAADPLLEKTGKYRGASTALGYQSARSQLANVSIEGEEENYLRIGGLLYTFISLKELPDATFPGVLRELVVLDFPVVISAEITLPDQVKALKGYKKQLDKMTSAQKGFHGGYRRNVDAEVAEGQLVQVLQDLISSSLKSCQMSMIIAARTTRPIRNRYDLREAERILDDRRARIIGAIGRMNGAKGFAETLAQKRLFFGSLPGLGGENKRELGILTLQAADLVPVEMPWSGTRHSALTLFETPYRQLIPFSLYDSALSNANLLIVGETGSGKTMAALIQLLRMARAKPLISILERGSNYAPLVQLMGGRIINVDLDGKETLNPWDLPPGETMPSNEKISFLKNLTRHMLGESPHSDNSLVEHVLNEAIPRVYQRCAGRYSNPIPTFMDLREELGTWRDAEKNERIRAEAQLASIKLRSWTGETGVYAKLFDRPTTMRLDSDWLFFNVEGLKADPRLDMAMSLVIANTMVSRASGKNGRPSVTVLDECWFLLDSPALAPEVVQLFRTGRTRYSSVWGISQTVEDFVGTDLAPRQHGIGILKCAHTKLIGKQLGDAGALEKHLRLNPVARKQVKMFGPPEKGRGSEMLLAIGENSEKTQTVRIVPSPIEYWIFTTFPREKQYRTWYLNKMRGTPLIECYQDLARRFPQGLADLKRLPEEESGAVDSVFQGAAKAKEVAGVEVAVAGR